MNDFFHRRLSTLFIVYVACEIHGCVIETLALQHYL